jgi:hypothetical protein
MPIFRTQYYSFDTSLYLCDSFMLGGRITHSGPALTERAGTKLLVAFFLYDVHFGE